MSFNNLYDHRGKRLAPKRQRSYAGAGWFLLGLLTGLLLIGLGAEAVKFLSWRGNW